MGINFLRNHLSMEKFAIFIWGFKRSVLLMTLGITPLFTAPYTQDAYLYSRIDNADLSALLAYAALYPDTKEGKLALQQSWTLLNGQGPLPNELSGLFRISSTLLGSHSQPFNQQEVLLIQKISQTLPHKKLKGHSITNWRDALQLAPEEIDIARTLFLLQDPERVDIYEAELDWMALQLLAQLAPEGGLKACPAKKIRCMNELIFQRMHFRFPPHAAYSANIDSYTFLASVLDQRLGVCLGVTILYTSLAQRLDLDLEIVTPPGHIFPRCITKEGILNIETTARGANPPSDVYLGINTKSLHTRNHKELIGLVYINAASVAAQNQDTKIAIDNYRIAEHFLPKDPLLSEYLAYQLYIDGQIEEARPLLEFCLSQNDPHSIYPESMVDDLFNGVVDGAGITAVLKHVDQTEASVREKQAALEKVLEHSPLFQEGLMQLAVTWIQLERSQEAIMVLQKLLPLAPKNPTLHYYLAMLYLECFDYGQAKVHAHTLETLLKEANHTPDALIKLKQTLQMHP